MAIQRSSFVFHIFILIILTSCDTSEDSLPTLLAEDNHPTVREFINNSGNLDMIAVVEVLPEFMDYVEQLNSITFFTPMSYAFQDLYQRMDVDGFEGLLNLLGKEGLEDIMRSQVLTEAIILNRLPIGEHIFSTINRRSVFLRFGSGAAATLIAFDSRGGFIPTVPVPSNVSNGVMFDSTGFFFQLAN
ncbi:MAG: hypothetical protein ACXIUD_15315 [Mongoliitalea sp.]